MGLFDRDDERYRSRGYDRDMGRGLWGRVERGFRGRDPNDVGMRSSHRGYGAEYRARGGRDFPHWSAGYDREMRGDDRNFLERAGDSMRRGWNELTGDDYDRGYRGRGSYDAGYGTTGGGMHPGPGGWGRHHGYGADYRGMHGSGLAGEGRYGRGVGYDPGFPRERGYGRHEYKSRHQTDTGDPFGDRQSRTPIRMVNEDYGDRLARRNAYDADLRHDRDWF